MSKTVRVGNRQGTQRVDVRRLGRIAQALLNELLETEEFDLGVYVVGAREMTRLNETYLGHQGATDVLAFDYREVPRQSSLSGEIFVCVEEAKRQAARFHTSWQSEVVRYLIHGVLHLKGYDDHQRERRRKMKKEEDRLLKTLGRLFEFSRL